MSEKIVLGLTGPFGSGCTYIAKKFFPILDMSISLYPIYCVKKLKMENILEVAYKIEGTVYEFKRVLVI